MQNSIFHNNKIFKKTLEKKKLSYLQNTNIKVNVDINKLLNRVKIEQNIEKKK